MINIQELEAMLKNLESDLVERTISRITQINLQKQYAPSQMICHLIRKKSQETSFRFSERWIRSFLLMLRPRLSISLPCRKNKYTISPSLRSENCFLMLSCIEITNLMLLLDSIGFSIGLKSTIREDCMALSNWLPWVP